MRKKRRRIRKPSPPRPAQKRRERPAESSATLEERRGIAEGWVRHHEEKYIGTPWISYVQSHIHDGHGHLLALQPSKAAVGNPLHVWAAYLECRDHGLPIPDWVLSYLDRVAARFWTQTRAGVTPPKEPAAAIAEILEMKRPGRGGRGNVFAAFDKRPDAGLAMKVDNLVEYHGQELASAIRSVAKDAGLHESTVRYTWDRYAAVLALDKGPSR
jgi:hypothetical protein